MDSEGQIDWFRQFTPYPYPENSPAFYQYTHIHHVLKTSDGGFLCTGEYASASSDQHPNGIQTAFALKVDEYGCLEEGCEVTGLFESSMLSKESSMSIYPNPTDGRISIELSVDTDISKLHSLRVIDSVGKTILQKQVNQLFIENATVLLDLGSLTSGMYSIVLNSSDGAVLSQHILFE